MTEENVEAVLKNGTGTPGITRRDLGKRGATLGAAVGAAWAAPMVFDSFSTPAAASGTAIGVLNGNLNTPVAA